MSEMLEKARNYETEKQVHATDPQTKPLFHVTAPTGWINDPNGFSVIRWDRYICSISINPYQQGMGTNALGT